MASSSGAISDEAVHFEYNAQVSGKTAKVRFVFRTLKDSVDVSEVAKHLETLESIRRALSHHVKRQEGATAESDELSDAAAVLVLAVLVIPFLVVGVVVVRKRWRKTQRLNSFIKTMHVGEGEGPEKPISISREADLPENLKRLRCRCGSAYLLGRDAPVQERLIYDGRRLIAVTLMCLTCGMSRDVYFAPRETE